MEKRVQVGIGVLIFNTKGQLLLGRRLNSHGSGSWQPPGGKMNFGETFEACARREVREETNMKGVQK